MDTQTTDYSKTTPRILPAYSQTNKLCLNKGSCALKRRAGSGRQYNICTQHPDYIHGHGYIICLIRSDYSQTTLSTVNLLLNEPGHLPIPPTLWKVMLESETTIYSKTTPKPIPFSDCYLTTPIVRIIRLLHALTLLRLLLSMKSEYLILVSIPSPSHWLNK